MTGLRLFPAAADWESLLTITVSVLRNYWSMFLAGVLSSGSHYTNIFPFLASAGCVTPLSFCLTSRITSPSYQPRGRTLKLILIRLTSSSAILTKFIRTFIKELCRHHIHRGLFIVLFCAYEAESVEVKYRYCAVEEFDPAPLSEYQNCVYYVWYLM